MMPILLGQRMGVLFILVSVSTSLFGCSHARTRLPASGPNSPTPLLGWKTEGVYDSFSSCEGALRNSPQENISIDATSKYKVRLRRFLPQNRFPSLSLVTALTRPSKVAPLSTQFSSILPAEAFRPSEEFAFDKMVKAGALTVEQRENLRQFTATLNPEQFTVLDLYSAQDAGDSEIVATLRLASGQLPGNVIRGRAGILQKLRVPWSLQYPDFAKKYLTPSIMIGGAEATQEFVWELARGASTGYRAIFELLDEAVFTALHEFSLFQNPWRGKNFATLDEAKMTIHSTVPRNTEYYMKGGFKLLGTGYPKPGENDVVLVRSLKELVEEHKSFRRIPGIAKITQTLPLSELEAHQLLEEIHLGRFRVADGVVKLADPSAYDSGLSVPRKYFPIFTIQPKNVSARQIENTMKSFVWVKKNPSGFSLDEVESFEKDFPEVKLPDPTEIVPALEEKTPFEQWMLANSVSPVKLGLPEEFVEVYGLSPLELSPPDLLLENLKYNLKLIASHHQRVRHSPQDVPLREHQTVTLVILLNNESTALQKALVGFGALEIKALKFQEGGNDGTSLNRAYPIDSRFGSVFKITVSNEDFSAVEADGVDQDLNHYLFKLIHPLEHQ